MNRIPLSCMNLAFPAAFAHILSFHLPKGGRIWDPTCGHRHSWEDYFRRIKNKGFGLTTPPLYDIHFTDISEGQDFRKEYFKNRFDGVFFDPPYIWGVKGSLDSRALDYGAYSGSKESLRRLIKEGFKVFHQACRLGGKVFFKYTDVFYKKAGRFYLGPRVWGVPAPGFTVVDHFIIQHHNINPTAFQVKDRPCSVGNHTYLTVLRVH